MNRSVLALPGHAQVQQIKQGSHGAELWRKGVEMVP